MVDITIFERLEAFVKNNGFITIISCIREINCIQVFLCKGRKEFLAPKEGSLIFCAKQNN